MCGSLTEQLTINSDELDWNALQQVTLFIFDYLRHSSQYQCMPSTHFTSNPISALQDPVPSPTAQWLAPPVSDLPISKTVSSLADPWVTEVLPPSQPQDWPQPPSLLSPIPQPLMADPASRSVKRTSVVSGQN